MNKQHAIDELKDVFELLSNDVEEARLYGQKNSSDFARRTLLRTHFALIEGMVFQLRQIAISAHEGEPNLFTLDEISILKEHHYQLNRKGLIETKDNYQKLLPMILFSIKCYTKIYNISYNVDTSNHGWEALKNYLGIRNQLMHPKSVSDLELNNEKLKTSTVAAKWFKDTLTNMINACHGI